MIHASRMSVEAHTASERALIDKRVSEVIAALASDSSYGWNLYEEPDLPEQLGRVAVAKLRRLGYITYLEGTGTVSISSPRR